jgi:glutaredoxin
MEARRCATHGLVLGEDGRCVICRRGEIPTTAKTSSDLPVVIIVVVMGVLTIGGLGYAATKRLSGLVSSKDPPVEPVTAPPADTENATIAAPVPTPTPRRRDDFPSISTSKPTAGEEPLEPSEEEIEALKRGVPVTMYARPDCSLCDSARTFMRTRRYSLKEFDVEASPTDKVVLKSLNPAGTMPTFVVDGRTIVGYDRTVLDEAIEKAATKRLNKK